MNDRKTFNPFGLLLPYQKKIFLDESPFVIAKMSRQSGKSFTISAKAVYKSILHDNALTVVVSANQRSADEFVVKCKKWAEAVKVCAEGLVDYTENASSVSFKNGSRIISLPASPQALRGWSGDVILDEFALVEDDQEIFQAVLPVITSQMNGRQHSLTVCSTPTTTDTMFAKLWFDRSGKWSKYSLTIYDAVAQGLKADPETLKAVVDDDLIWDTEYMVRFSSGAGSAFPSEWQKEMGYIEAEDEKECRRDWYLGFDVARRGDYSVAVVAYQDGDAVKIADVVKMKDRPFNEQLAEIKKLDAKYQFRAGYVDAVGIGGMLAEEIHRTVSARICPFSWNSVNKPRLYDGLRTLLQDGRLKVKEEFLDEVKADMSAVKRYVNSVGRISYTAPHTPDGHSDITSAVCLAANAIRENPVNFLNIIPYTRRSVL